MDLGKTVYLYNPQDSCARLVERGQDAMMTQDSKNGMNTVKVYCNLWYSASSLHAVSCSSFPGLLVLRQFL
jgi:hypothetical protein